MSERNSIVLRADSPALRDQWLSAITDKINALRALAAPADARVSPPIVAADAAAAPTHDMQSFASLPCNAECADCGAAAPRWASFTHKVLICVACAAKMQQEKEMKENAYREKQKAEQELQARKQAQIRELLLEAQRDKDEQLAHHIAQREEQEQKAVQEHQSSLKQLHLNPLEKIKESKVFSAALLVFAIAI
jgi:hypothetical protein